MGMLNALGALTLHAVENSHITLQLALYTHSFTSSDSTSTVVL